ncbi:MAG TPA: carboxypeptidase-like regulatory domain-containing protein, partial [Planctomycetota bacterium]|nr:carboxypeptidase-like regulatory domain-containing protein [Planctomycetota bacterium]
MSPPCVANDTRTAQAAPGAGSAPPQAAGGPASGDAAEDETGTAATLDGAWIAGRVLDERGEPLARAIVRPRSRPTLAFAGESVIAPDTRDPSVVETDATGRFAVVAPAGEPTSLLVRRTGYRALETARATPVDGKRVDLGDVRLERLGAGTLGARVVDAAGAPYRGEVRLEVSGADDARETACDGLRTEGLTDDAGRLHAPSGDDADGGEGDSAEGPAFAARLTAGRYRVRAVLGSGTCRPVLIEVADGASVEATLVAEPLPALRIRVVDDGTGAPVAGAQVIVHGVDPDALEVGNGGEWQTDADGVAAASWPGARWYVEVTAPGFRGVAPPLGRPDADAFHVDLDAARLESGLTVRLRAAMRIEGRLLGPDGAPRRGWVAVRGQDREEPAGDDGSFAFEVPAAGPVVLHGRASDCAPVERTIAAAPGGRATVDLVLGAPG